MADSGMEADAGQEAQSDAATSACDPGFTGPDCTECVVFVDGDTGLAANSGSSWQDAVPTVQNGIDRAVDRIGTDGIESCAVWVKAGLYVPSPRGSADEQTATFELAPAVHAYGGFDGSEDALDQRDWQSNPTILSADLTGNDIPGDDDSLTDNALHVVTGASDSTLDGFMVVGGFADEEGGGREGAGMVNRNVSDMLVANTTFDRNIASSKPGATNGRGGAMANINSAVILRDVRFTGNLARSTNSGHYARGGAMFNQSSNVSIEGAAFIDNVVTATTSTARGGAIYQEGSGSLTLVNASFVDNSASTTGTQAASGAAVHFGSSTAVLTIVNSMMKGNSAQFGGALRLNGAARLSNVTMTNNTASEDGGAIYWTPASAGDRLQVVNSILWQNQAEVGADEIHVGAAEQIDDVDVSFSIIDGGHVGVSNIDEDPVFADLALRVQSGSPAIDSGSSELPPGFPDLPATDLDGNPRTADGTASVAGAVIDRGAYEFVAE